MTGNNNNHADTPGSDTEQAKPGEMIRHARELRELSAEDLARCLRLEPKIIHHLESEQFDQLPAPAFIRGYVRSIAKELDIDSAPLIDALALRFNGAPPPLADFESRAPIEITSDSNVIRYTTFGIVIVILMLVALWWQAHNEQTTNPAAASEPTAAAENIPATAPLPYDFEVVVHPDTPFYRLAPSPTTQVAIPVLETAAPTFDSALLAATPDSAVLIKTREDAWIDIRDADGTRLFYDLACSGREISLSGKLPYSLTLGNAQAVSVEFRGQQVTVADFIEAGIARFKLGNSTP